MKPMRKPKKLPNTRIGWHRHFATKFNKNENPQTAQLSLWYLFLHLAFDVPEPVKDALDEQDFYEVCQAYRHADNLFDPLPPWLHEAMTSNHQAFFVMAFFSLESSYVWSKHSPVREGGLHHLFCG